MNIIKIKKVFLFTIFIFLIPSSTFAGNLVLTSLGHSSFLIKGDKRTVLINPFKAIGCASGLDEPKNINASFILASSKLADEGYNPNKKLMFVDPGIYKYKDITLNGIQIPHDRVGGRRFGMATVWIWEQNDLKIVHMGGAAGEIDINSQIALSRPDILFISIGGGIKSYDGIEASRVIEKLKPLIVIPVHFAKYKKNSEGCNFSNSDLFIENLKDFKVNYVGSTYEINPERIDRNTIYFFSD